MKKDQVINKISRSRISELMDEGHVNCVYKKDLETKEDLIDKDGKKIPDYYYFSIRYLNDFGDVKQLKEEHKTWKLKRQADQALKEFKALFQQEKVKKNNTSNRLTFDDVFTKFINEKKTETRVKTIENYQSTYDNQLKDTFGHLEITEINKENIIDFKKGLLEKEYRNTYNLKIQEHFKTILNYAVDNDYIQKSPWTRNTKLALNTSEIPEAIKFWTYDEFLMFIEEIQELEYRTFYEVLYHCGLRRSECIGLHVSDVSFEKNEIKINKQYDNKHKTYGPPKSKNSVRTIKMNNKVRDSIMKLIESNKNSISYTDDSILFGINKHLAPKTIENKMKRAIKKLELKSITIHGLRHSHVSLLINMGVSSFEIAERIGDTVDMVHKTYAHLFEDTKNKTMEDLNRYLENHNASITNNEKQANMSA